MAILAGILTAVVGAGLSAGLAAASQPDLVNPAKSSRRAVLASLRALPGQRAVERAARLGEAVDFPTGKMEDVFETRQMTRTQLEEARSADQISPQDYNRFDRALRDQEAARDRYQPGAEGPEPTVSVKIKTGTRSQTRHADFTGYGDADIQGKLAKQLAQIQLDLQKKYGADFVTEAKRQQELADPEGTAARRLLASEINRMEDERAGRQHLVANRLDAQVLDELQRGQGVTAEASDLTNRLKARRGDVSADVLADLEGGMAGEARESERLQKALGYLGSGATPQDAAYRERQQGMANMASFLGGRTPQSQFASLSGAQQGASPVPRGPSLPGVDPNLMGNAQQAGLQSYQAGVHNAATQVSPWFVGLSGLVKGVQAYNAGRAA